MFTFITIEDWSNGNELWYYSHKYSWITRINWSRC